MNRKWSILLSALTLTFSPAVSYAGDIIVRKVEIATQGEQAVNEDVIRARIKLQEGQVFKQELNDESIRALYATRLFDYVEVKSKSDVEKNAIDIVYVLYPKEHIFEVDFSGNHAISSRKLRREIKSQSGSPLDQAQIKADVDALVEFYRGKGYPDATVESVVSRDEKSGENFLRFEIFEGSRLPIQKICFVGNQSVKSRALRQVMALHSRTIFSILDGSGYLKPELLNQDLEQLRNYYRNQGFLDVEIRAEDVEVVKNEEKSITVVIHIDEGPRFTVGTIEFVGNTLFSDRQLNRLLALHSGEYFSPERVDATEEAVRYYYGQRGYMESYVTTQRHADVITGAINLTFVVHESEKSKVGLIEIQGNTKTKNNVILREISLTPGDTFDLVKVRNSENRLRETRYFNQVSIMPETSPLPNYHDALITVEEANTGKINFGGAMTSLDNIVGFLEFSQSNFDLLNYKSHFQGGGQKFRMRGEFGTRTQQAVIAFEEPWVCERELAFESEIFYTRSEYKKSDHNYEGASYDERHEGFEFAFRKRLIELLEGRVYYRLDNAKIYNIGKFAPIPLQHDAALGARWVSKTGLQLIRDTRDSLLYPTMGNRISFQADYAGLGGDVNYMNFDFQAGQWFKVSNYHTQTLAFFVKSGAIKPFEHQETPYFSRKFLGGPDDMRGFDYQGVGPKDRLGQPLGCNTYLYGCSEYSFKVAEPFRAVLFFEGAYMGEKFLNLDKPLYLDAGVELRIFVMGSPLRLIFGYPLKGDDYYKHHLQFNFSFGTNF